MDINSFFLFIFFFSYVSLALEEERSEDVTVNKRLRKINCVVTLRNKQ